MFADNDWYAHKKIFFEYCGFKKTFPIYGTLQHGYFEPIESNIITKSIYPKCPYFSYNKEIQKKYERKNFSIIPIGSAFLYLCKIKEKKIIKTSTGVVLFPAHSNAEGYTEVNHEKIIKIIKEKYKSPYKVVLFHTDYFRKNIMLYKKHKFKVFCCGKRGDPFFLYKLYDIISRTEYVVSTEPSSALLYSMYLKKKCKIIYKDKQSKFLNFYNNRKIKKYPIYSIFFRKLSKKNYTIKEQNEQFAFAKKKLGKTSMRSPSELKTILGLDNILLRFIAFFISKLQNILNEKSARDFGILSYQDNSQPYKWFYDKKKNSYYRKKNKHFKLV